MNCRESLKGERDKRERKAEKKKQKNKFLNRWEAHARRSSTRR